jgi:hypothetical protein
LAYQLFDSKGVNPFRRTPGYLISGDTNVGFILATIDYFFLFDTCTSFIAQTFVCATNTGVAIIFSFKNSQRQGLGKKTKGKSGKKNLLLWKKQ